MALPAPAPLSDALAPGSPHPVLTAYYASAPDRAGYVRRLFDAAAPDYDRLNGLFSLGTGRRYRRTALLHAGLGTGAAVLDVACGTGLVAAEARRLVGPAGTVVALDASAGMLRLARSMPEVALIQGSMDLLPLRADRFDMVTMGYALRHVSALDTAFAEFFRVLRPGGRLLLLEIGRPERPRARLALRLYLGRIVPALSRIVGSSRRAGEMMRYYWDTIEHCVPPAAITAALERAGFAAVSCRTELGVLRTFSAQRP